MATTEYAITIDDAYETPEGPLSKAQYVEFVMNRAAQSYQAQYGVAGADAGIEAAVSAYNAALPSAETDGEA